MRMRIMFSSIKKWLVCYPLVAASLSLLLAGGAQAQVADPGAGAKQLWQLIDYVAVDYSGAVEHGKVVSAAEYAEMLDFTDNATTQIAALPAHASQPAIAAAIADLRKAVVAKADGAEVKRLAHHANGLLITAYPIPVAPKVLPNLARGAALYAAQCASCHGVAGGGQPGTETDRLHGWRTGAVAQPDGAVPGHFARRGRHFDGQFWPAVRQR